MNKDNSLIRTILLLAALITVKGANAQFVATTEQKTPIAGACNTKVLYALFSGLKDQTEPVCPLSKAEIEAKLQNEVQLLKDNPKTKGKLMVSCVLNCKGELIQCSIDNKSGNAELDNQVLEIFKTIKQWKPGLLQGKEVDCIELFSIEVKKGIVKLT